MNEHPVQRVPVLAAVEALTQAMRVWDEDCFRHSLNTAAYAAAIARELGMDAEAADEVRIGALLHDIGKMGVDLGVLRKPGRLDDHEAEHVHLHPEIGASILERVLPQSVVDCAVAHHEQPDGRGYPRRLTEAQIPVAAMICRVADVLDSLMTPQTYRGALSLEEALAELRDGAGTRYGATVVAALVRLIERDELQIAA
jgi:putative nucleotidyltransferase with HDIG domain